LLPVGYLKETEIELILGKEYLVMGITIFDNYLYYLIDEDSRPSWFPYIFFKISDSRLSSNWYFNKITTLQQSTSEVVLGYYDLCFVKGYSDRLMGRNEYEMRIYFREKMKIENNETD
jgi:hypothetical protein